MGSLISLAIYGAIGLALMATVVGFVHHHDSGVREEEAALWKPKVAAAEQDRDTAIAANKTLQASVAQIDAERQQCSKGVEALQAAGAQADKAKAAALVTAGTKIGELTRDRDRLESLLAIPEPYGETCDAKLAKIHTELDTVAARRMRYNPGPASGDGGKDVAPSKGSGNPTLRIGK